MKQWICIFTLVSILSQGSYAVYGQVVLAKLDLSEVSFVLMTNEGIQKQLEDQALKQFQKAGLPLNWTRLSPPSLDTQATEESVL